MLKIGLIGTGHLGKIHLRLLKELSEWEFVGFYDANVDVAAKISAEYNIKAFNSAAALLSEIDAVDIVTPTLSHFELAKAALETGKHVFLEKPITHTIKEAETLVKLAQEKGLVGQVGHVERFNPAFLALQGKEMNPMFIEGHRLALWNPRGTDVSVVLDLMIHDLDILLSVVKSPIINVHANGVAVLAESPDIANVRIEFENGCVANLTASRISMKNMRKIRFFQKNTYISVDFLDKKTDIIRLAEAGEESVEGKQQVFNFDTGSGMKQMVMEMPEIETVNSIKMELAEFSASILHNAPVRVSFHDACEALKAAYLIIEKM